MIWDSQLKNHCRPNFVADWIPTVSSSLAVQQEKVD